MSNDKIVYSNKWTTVVERNGYVMTTQPWCQSIGVSILPFRRDSLHNILVRYERIIAHGESFELGCITGGYDNSDKFTIPQCVLNELEEEAGLIGDPKNLIHLGTIRPNKSSNVTTYLFAIDVNYCAPCEARGDGTESEKGAFPIWVTPYEAILSPDPTLSVMIQRLKLKGIELN